MISTYNYNVAAGHDRSTKLNKKKKVEFVPKSQTNRKDIHHLETSSGEMDGELTMSGAQRGDDGE